MIITEVYTYTSGKDVKNQTMASHQGVKPLKNPNKERGESRFNVSEDSENRNKSCESKTSIYDNANVGDIVNAEEETPHEKLLFNINNISDDKFVNSVIFYDQTYVTVNTPECKAYAG